MNTVYPLFFMISIAACNRTMEEPQSEQSQQSKFACTPEQGAPYPNGIPYVGIHADAGNSDIINCKSADAWEDGWFSLQDLGMTQPNTFSPDGSVLYATTSNRQLDGCRVHAVDAKTGDVLWCKSYNETVSRSAIEVDEEGNLYFTVEDTIVSLAPSGAERWTTQFPLYNNEEDSPWGVHFNPSGHVVTVTSSGTVFLLERSNGATIASFDIQEEWGFVSSAGLNVSSDISALVPESVLENIKFVWGEDVADSSSVGFTSLLGAAAFCDNTIGISPEGDIYVIGGGPDKNTGALTQIRVDEAGNLVKGWYTPVHTGSATSPSISKNGRYVVIADGSSATAYIDPSSVDARVKVMDIEACNANTDSDPDPSVCGVAYEHKQDRMPMIGAPAISNDGTVYYWEFGLDLTAQPEDRDVIAFNREGVVWESVLPDDLDWVSVMTVTENHIIGTVSHIQPSEHSLLGFRFPAYTEDELIALDRQSGAVRWRSPLPDDGAATVSIGPDGSLYVGVYGLLSTLSTEERPNMGLKKFSTITP